MPNFEQIPAHVVAPIANLPAFFKIGAADFIWHRICCPKDRFEAESQTTGRGGRAHRGSAPNAHAPLLIVNT